MGDSSSPLGARLHFRRSCTSRVLSPDPRDGPHSVAFQGGPCVGRSWFKPRPLSSWTTSENFPDLGFSICKMEGKKYLPPGWFLVKRRAGPAPPRRHGPRLILFGQTTSAALTHQGFRSCTALHPLPPTPGCVSLTEGSVRGGLEKERPPTPASNAEDSLRG